VSSGRGDRGALDEVDAAEAGAGMGDSGAIVASMCAWRRLRGSGVSAETPTNRGEGDHQP
jgi:hypothetical protein